MKKPKKNPHEPILEKIVSTPNGEYQIKLVKATETPFSSSFDFCIKHLNPGFLELFLGQDVEIHSDACHDYEDVYLECGRAKFKNTIPQEIGYHSNVRKFYIHFHQDPVFPDKNISLPELPRTKHFPIPDSSSRDLRNYFKSIYTKIRGK
ncbi:MAG: hypothetical protein WC584_02195 [Candidatus Pacearchaeota archaeon]